MWKQVKYIFPRLIKPHPEFCCVHSSGQSLRAPCAAAVHGRDNALGSGSMLQRCHWEEHGGIGILSHQTTLGVISGLKFMHVLQVLSTPLSRAAPAEPWDHLGALQGFQADLRASFQLQIAHTKGPDQLIASLFISARQPRAELARNRNHR